MYRLLRLPEVLSMTGLTKSALYRLIKNSQFPQSVKLANTTTTAWPEHLVQQWIKEQIEQSAQLAVQ